MVSECSPFVRNLRKRIVVAEETWFVNERGSIKHTNEYLGTILQRLYLKDALEVLSYFNKDTLRMALEDATGCEWKPYVMEDENDEGTEAAKDD